MVLHIEDAAVEAKIERLAKSMGITEIAVVKQALKKMIEEQKEPLDREAEWAKFHAMLEEFDKLPRNENYVDPLEWDENGLPI